MRKNVSPARARLARGFCALIALALLMIAAQPREARAQWATSGNNISSTNTGNVGVGTSAPAKRLDVNGSIFAGNSITLGKGVTNFSGVGFNRDVDVGTILDPQRGAYQIHDEAVNSKLFFSAWNAAGTLLGYPLTFDGTKVGIGTTSPGAYKLNVSGPIFGRAAYSTYTPDGLYGATATPSRIQTDSGGGGGILFGYEDWGYGDYSPRVGLQQSYDAAYAPYLITTKASIGLVRDGSITVKGGANHAEYMRVTAAGNVGVGTESPGAKLDVSGVIRSSAGGGFSIGGDIGRRRIEMGGPGDSTFFFLNASDGAAAAAVGGLAILGSYSNPVAPANGLYVQGQVGIGTATPGAAYKLDVSGSINASQDLNVAGTITGGNITAKYQDVAEWVPSTQRLAAGTVVVLDTARDNHVLASHTAYDTRVAGVISAQPGISLGQAGEGKVLVATTGRVKVKVDASRGAIRIGDLIVTSEVPGVAMRSEPVMVGGVAMHRPGTLIGKALEPLAGGTGEILVLLSMQ
ncbi:MAG TPA: hypothetical protein VIP46_21370 [Pyrinomonadaceae bacterium]